MSSAGSYRYSMTRLVATKSAVGTVDYVEGDTYRCALKEMKAQVDPKIGVAFAHVVCEIRIHNLTFLWRIRTGCETTGQAIYSISQVLLETGNEMIR